MYNHRSRLLQQQNYLFKSNLSLTPVCAPTVAANPVVNTVLGAPAVELDSMVGGAGVAGIVHVHTPYDHSQSESRERETVGL